MKNLGYGILGILGAIAFGSLGIMGGYSVAQMFLDLADQTAQLFNFQWVGIQQDLVKVLAIGFGLLVVVRLTIDG